MTEHPDHQPRAGAYPEDQRAAVYRVIGERRDVRQGFLPDPVPAAVLGRVLAAAHQAPSVGFSQPWDFIVITDRAQRERIAGLARRNRDGYAAGLPGARSRAFADLKVESILDTPVNIAVTCDATRGGRHTLGRHSQPETAAFSSVLAVSNLWLAARAEGIGVGWVSFFDERELAAELGLPAHLEVVAYLCAGYVREFGPEPELQATGWARRRPVAWAVHEGAFGQRGLPGEEPVDALAEVTAAIRPLDAEAVAAARERQDRMTKPPGSLGVLEDVSVQLAGLAGECPPPLPEPAAVAIFAGDHGVHAQGVTPWPQEVTAQMVANFLAGGAVVNAFAAQAGAEVVVVDVGVAADLEPAPGLLPRKVAHGTADFTRGPAMTSEQAVTALTAGLEVARDLVAAGNRCLVTGDMGIANTTASAALICAFTGSNPAVVTGARSRGRRGRAGTEGGGHPAGAGAAPARPGRPGRRARRVRWLRARRAGRVHPGRGGAAGAGHPGRGHRRGRGTGGGGHRPGRGGRLPGRPSQHRTRACRYAWLLEAAPARRA